MTVANQRSNSPAPRLTVLLIGFHMPEQLANTLYSLRHDYQRNVSQEDYEVVLVENRSACCLAPEAVASLPDNFRYFLRDEAGVSPAAAINFGLEQARGEYVCLMIDGARLLTPGVLGNILRATVMRRDCFVAVPGYTLGYPQEHDRLGSQYCFELDRTHLQQLGWPANGYGLFERSFFSKSNLKGFFFTNTESNCLTVRREELEKLGGADERFNLKGGGMLNLYFYRELLKQPRLHFFLLAGEGTFHQYHGGATSSGADGFDEFVDEMQAQYTAIAGERYVGVQREPVLLGQISEQAMAFMEESFERATIRYGRYEKRGQPEWPDEAVHF